MYTCQADAKAQSFDLQTHLAYVKYTQTWCEHTVALLPNVYSGT